MERLFSPWRSRYIDSFIRTPVQEDEECLFCRAAREKKDARNLVVVRKKFCFTMMNLYPYNSGHLMVVPYTHTSDLAQLSQKEYSDILQTVSEMLAILKRVMQPQGFNVGVNLGKVGGAGIDQHVHFHIVPRWNGDTNFMPVLADVKIVSEAIQGTYKKITRALRS
jgi:ATP adenylyltransferase